MPVMVVVGVPMLHTSKAAQKRIANKHDAPLKHREQRGHHHTRAAATRQERIIMRTTGAVVVVVVVMTHLLL